MHKLFISALFLNHQIWVPVLFSRLVTCYFRSDRWYYCIYDDDIIKLCNHFFVNVYPTAVKLIQIWILLHLKCFKINTSCNTVLFSMKLAKNSSISVFPSRKFSAVSSDSSSAWWAATFNLACSALRLQLCQSKPQFS